MIDLFATIVSSAICVNVACRMILVPVDAVENKTEKINTNFTFL
jgi:hypothetical protein